MKKKLLIAGILVLSMACMSGCGKKKKSAGDNTETASSTDSQTEVAVDSKSELMKLVNEDIPSLSDKRDAALEIYNSYFSADGPKLDKYADKIKNEALPNMKSYIDGLDALNYQADEVKALRDLCVESAKKQYEAIELVSKAIEDKDDSKLKDADKCVNESKELDKKYQDEVKKLAASLGIDVIDNTVVSTTTDATATDASETDAK